MKKFLWTIFTVIFVSTIVSPSLVLAQTANPRFNPNMIIPDTVFSDTSTFGSADGIQKFLEARGSVLADTSSNFVLKLKEPGDSNLKQFLLDPNPNQTKLRTAAELIWDSAQSSGLNPQVILVTLHKEQGLMGGSFGSDSNLQRALDHSMGFACPDDGKCDGLLSGFYFQLFGNMDTEGNRLLGAPKSLIRSFKTPGGRGPTLNGKTAGIGDSITLPNTLGDYDGIPNEQTIILENRATAALYRYTPHVFNGNYNFWKFYIAWFKYPDGTLLKDTLTGTLYILQKGNRREIPAFVARIRKMNIQNAISVSATELSNYPAGTLLGPRDNTIVMLEGKKFLMIKGIKYPVSDLVLTQKNLDPTKAVRITATEAILFASGKELLPKDGTVVRIRGKTTMYLVKKGVLKQFSRFTLRQYDASKDAQFISQSEFDRYPHSGFVAPKDGTLIKGKTSSTIYVMKDGTKHPLTNTLFVNLKLKKSDVVKLSDTEINSLITGTYAPPRDGTYFFENETNDIYLFKNNSKHLVSKQIAEARNIKPRIGFFSTMVKDWITGDPIK